MKLTPAEVHEIASAVSLRDGERIKLQSWLTASLTGFAKVPDFDTCFPKHREIRPRGHVDIGAIFASGGHRVIHAND